MSVPLTAAPGRTWQALRTSLPPLLLGLIILALLFRREIASAVGVWRDSTAYNHCFLVLPIAAWLAYERRHRLTGLRMQPMPQALLLGLPLVLVWLVAERLGIMEGRQLAALGFVELLVLVLLGRAAFRAMRAPLLYLLFLVPFGAFLTGSLQDFTAEFVVRGLDLLGIANYSDGYTIEIPEGVFYVAEACAGLRFLIAAVAFGVLYAIMLYRSPGRRLLFVGVSVVVPILANGVRALGIVVAGHLIGSAQAAAADHLIYGWLFFSLVIVLLILAGLPFRQDAQAARPVSPAGGAPDRLSGILVPLALVLAIIAATGPLLAAGLDRAAAAQVVSSPGALAGCTLAGTGNPSLDSESRAMLSQAGAVAEDFLCQQGELRLQTVLFPPRTNPMLILGAQRRLSGQLSGDDVEIAALANAGAPGWQGVQSHQPTHFWATALWIDGLPGGSGLRSRLLQGLRSLRATHHPVVLAVAQSAGGTPVASLLREANAAGGISAQLAAWSGGTR